MGKLAIVFAGQGSQYTGMGLDFCEINPESNQKLNQASSILGYDVRTLLTSENGEMNQTLYTQPLMMLATIFAYDELLKYVSKVDGVLGFSLGEYSALYAASIFSFEDLVQIISKRASFMHEQTQKYPGKMAAILGLDAQAVNEICSKVKSGLVVCANYNSPTQTVISGEAQAVEDAVLLCKENGAKRAIVLNVSGAFHSPLMKEAGEKLFEVLRTYQTSKPEKPLYLNSTSRPLIFSELKEEMKKQIFSPVLFTQSIEHMIEDGFTHFIEVGPGTVLSGLIRKISVNLEVTNLSSIQDLDNLKGWLNTHGFAK